MRFSVVAARRLYQRRVVILVDEYDKPILDQINDVEECRKNRELLKGFYGVLKAMDSDIEFIFLTGVTKFSKVSIFSGLNNLDDITMTKMASTLFGYTREELEINFADQIKMLAEKQHKTLNEIYELIQHWYNGYQFSEDTKRVYNPFSVLLLLEYKQFKSYWFESGTPTFLMDIIERERFEIEEIENISVDPSSFSNFDLDFVQSLPLLYQTGYLTIKNVDDKQRYRLGYPNYEVEYSFINSLLTKYANINPLVRDSTLNALENSLEERDFDRFFNLLK